MEEIFQLACLDGPEIEKPLLKQLAYVNSALKLNYYREEYFSILCQRKSPEKSTIENAVSTLKEKVQTPAYRELMTGKNTQSVEPDRHLKNDYDKLQINYIFSEIVLEYSKALKSGLQKYFDILGDERSGTLFSQLSILEIPNKNISQYYATKLKPSDYEEKSALFQLFAQDLFSSATPYQPAKNTSDGKDAEKFPSIDGTMLLFKKDVLARVVHNT